MSTTQEIHTPLKEKAPSINRASDLEIRLREELSALAKRLDECNRRIEEVAKERDIVRERHDALRRYIEVSFGPVNERADSGPQEGTANEVKSPTTGPQRVCLPFLVQEVEAVLSEVWPDSLHYREILLRLEKRGTAVPGSNPGANLLAHITRFPQLFERTGRGRYKLRQHD